MLLKLALWHDVQEYLERRTDVVVPFGSTEQHGPSGPLGTDSIVAEELANGQWSTFPRWSDSSRSRNP